MSKKANKKSAKNATTSKVNKKSSKKTAATILNQDVMNMAPMAEHFNAKDFGRTILLNALETNTSSAADLESFQRVMYKPATPFQHAIELYAQSAR